MRVHAPPRASGFDDERAREAGRAPRESVDSQRSRSPSHRSPRAPLALTAAKRQSKSAAVARLASHRVPSPLGRAAARLSAEPSRAASALEAHVMTFARPTATSVDAEPHAPNLSAVPGPSLPNRVRDLSQRSAVTTTDQTCISIAHPVSRTQPSTSVGACQGTDHRASSPSLGTEGDVGARVASRRESAPASLTPRARR